MLSSKRVFLTFATLLLLSLQLSGGEMPFSPIIRNFPASEYQSARQNWAVTRAPDGFIYVANSTSLLEYDGHSWNRYFLPNKGIVRSVYAHGDGKIYCGSYQEFGYFEKDAAGLRYHSLSEGIDVIKGDLSDTWNIYQDSRTGAIVFQSFKSIYIYDGDSVRCIQDVNPLNLMKVGDVLYSQLIGGDFVRLDGVQLSPVIGREDLQSDVVAAFEYEGKFLIITSKSGLFHLEPDGSLRAFRTEADKVFTGGIANRAVLTKDGNLVIGTINEGIVCIDAAGRMQWKVDAENRLKCNTVLGLLCDEDNNIWAALDDGVSFIDNSAGIGIFVPARKNIGMITDVYVDGDEFFLATNHAIYRYGDGVFSSVPGFTEQVWCLEKIGDELVCGYNQGTYAVHGNSSELITDNAYGTYFITEDSYNGERWVIEGTYSHPCLFRIDDRGEWEYVPSLDDVHQMINHIETEAGGNLWCADVNGGVHRIKMNGDRSAVEKIDFFDTLGDVKDSLFSVMKINERVVLSNGKSFFTYDSLNDSIVPYDAMNSGLLPRAKNIHQTVRAGDNLYWLVSDKAVYLVEYADNRFTIRRTIPFSYFNVFSEEQATITYDSRSGNSYLCLNNTLVRIRTKKFLSKTRHTDKELSLVAVTASDVYGRGMEIPVNDGVKIGYRHNSLTFLLSYPVYNEIDTRFRFQLKGLSSDWIDTDQFLQREYTRLSYGKYQLNVEAYAGEEVLKSCSFSFSIRPPWYIQWWMKIVYAALFLSIMYSVFSVTSKKVKKEQELLHARQEMERLKIIEQQEKEIVRMKQERLEEDLKEKSKEMASTAMTLIAHQEILESLSKEIRSKKLSGGANKKDLDELLRMIDNHMVSDKETWDMFQANFDRIHENFFRRLKEVYPTLTPTDLKLCAMLRMNLSTKEIANMLNLTIRGVESARYRLRKKFNLPSEDGLTDYLIKFS